MTDKELLELAAKAAENGAYFPGNDPFALRDMVLQNGMHWNPLDNKHDTLELEIKLKATTTFEEVNGEWFVHAVKNGRGHVGKHKDRQRATTLCAAEIGKTL